MKLVLASKNQGKLKELQAILSDLKVEVLLESEVGIDVDVEETGTTFEENSLLKASTVMACCKLPTIADDSGLIVDALDGAPGVYSARYGNLDSDEARTEFLLKNMEAVPDEKRTARFVSVVTCCMPSGTVITARGECEGTITRVPRGDGGFGYDPVFYVPELDKTFSELMPEEKNQISHRANALRIFAQKLTKEIEDANK